MANRMKAPTPHENMHVLRDKRQMPKGGSKMAHKHKKSPTKSNLKKGAKTMHVTEVGSDETDNGSTGGDSEEDDNDSDTDGEPDGIALPGVRRVNKIQAHPAGFNRREDSPAIAGVEDEVSDEDYGAVDNISDSEDSEQDEDEDLDQEEGLDEEEKSVLRAARKDLIEEFEEAVRPRTATTVTAEMTGLCLEGAEDGADARRMSLQSQDSSLVDFWEDPFGGLSTQDSLYHELIEDAEDVFDNDLASWRIPNPTARREASIQSNGNEKKVRFVETAASSRSSSLSSEDDPRDSFPDLFDGTEDPMKRSQMLVDFDMAQDNDSTYDFDVEEEHERMSYEVHLPIDSDSEMSEDSDDGDTTDEEDANAQLARVRAIRSTAGAVPPANSPVSAPSTPTVSRPASTVLKSTAGGRRPASGKAPKMPRSGTFTHDPTRAAVKADVNGSGVQVSCPAKPPEKDEAFWERARQAMGSRDGSPGNGPVSWTRSTPRGPSVPQRPFTAKSTLGTMFDGNLDFLRTNDDLGIANELIVASSTSTIVSSFTSSKALDQESSSFDDSNVNMEDYVQMGDSDSDMEDEPHAASLMSPHSESSKFPDLLDDSPFEPTASDLLDHFDQQRGLVSSFRNNQNLARHVSGLAVNPASRAQTSEANALQIGRRAAANTPMTPARKNRASQDFKFSHPAGIKKATASPLVQKHRRSRGGSLSQTLALDRFPESNNRV